MRRRPPRSPLFPYTTLFRSREALEAARQARRRLARTLAIGGAIGRLSDASRASWEAAAGEYLRARAALEEDAEREGRVRDRKSTRLNSSHSQISYAVFCLKQ